MKLAEIDEVRIQEILLQARELHHCGAMDRDTWLRLNREFVDASHGRLGMPGVLAQSGKSEWFAELSKALKQPAA